MFIIGEAIVEEDVAFQRFECDLSRCHGACCTIRGGRGAPLADEEVEEIERVYPEVKRFLSKRSQDVISSEGMVEGTPGHYFTVCIDNQDCVFVYYKDGIARCSLERAFLDGLTGWQKPLSCHLFPIRVDREGGEKLRYEQIAECKPGIKRGVMKDIPLYDFLKEPLVRTYGAAWYDEFREACILRDNLNKNEI